MQNRTDFPIIEQPIKNRNSFGTRHECYIQEYQASTALHYHDCLEIGRCIKGNGLLYIDGDIYSFVTNSVVYIPAGVIHDSHIIMSSPDEEPSVWEYINVDLNTLGVFSKIQTGRVFLSNTITNLFQIMYNVLEENSPTQQKEFELLLNVMNIEVDKRSNNIRRRDCNRNNDALIVPALDKITHDYAQDISVVELAKLCNMSESYFRKQFTLSIGMSPQQYLIHFRLTMAEHMLKTTEKTILAISEDVGFRSLSSFNRLFLQKYGAPPSTFR